MNQSTAENRRRAGRIRDCDVHCSHGHVVDLSATGMRLRCASLSGHTPGQMINIKLAGYEIEISLYAEVVWSKRSGLMQHTFGVRFLNLTDEVTFKLSRIASQSRLSFAA